MLSPVDWQRLWRITRSSQFAISAGKRGLFPDTLRDASIQIRIKAASLELMDEVSEYDRGEIDRVTFNEVLEVSRFPEIVYTSSQITATRLSENLYGTTIAGKLTLHGVTDELDFSAQVVIGDDTLRGYGSFPVKQSKYDIAIASIAGGTLKMRDELKIAFFIIAKKQG